MRLRQRTFSAGASPMPQSQNPPQKRPLTIDDCPSSKAEKRVTWMKKHLPGSDNTRLFSKFTYSEVLHSQFGRLIAFAHTVLAPALTRALEQENVAVLWTKLFAAIETRPTSVAKGRRKPRRRQVAKLREVA